MSIQPVTCPYCNSLVTVKPGTTRGQRLPCARCGESFTLLTTEPASTDLSEQPSAPAFDVEPSSYEKRWPRGKPFRANRRTALILLGVMAFMAVAALAYALHTQMFRRDNDKGIVKINPKRRPPLDDAFSPDDLPVPPAKLAALAWLPQDTTVILGVHVHELLANPTGKALLTQPLDIGGKSIGLDTLAEWTEFKIDDIDHLVLGLNAEKIVPTWFLIVRSRQDIDAKEFYQRLNAQHTATTKQGRDVYEFLPPKPLPLFDKLYVCLVDDRTAVYTWLRNHFDDLPAAPQPELRQLPLEVRDVLKNRVGPVGPLWIAGHSDDWKKTRVPFLFQNRLNSMQEQDRRRLLKVSTFAVWVEVDDPMLVRAALNCGDDPTAKEVQQYFDIPDAGADPDWKASTKDGWLSVQIRASLKKVRAALER